MLASAQWSRGAGGVLGRAAGTALISKDYVKITLNNCILLSSHLDLFLLRLPSPCFADKPHGNLPENPIYLIAKTNRSEVSGWCLGGVSSLAHRSPGGKFFTLPSSASLFGRVDI